MLPNSRPHLLARVAREDGGPEDGDGDGDGDCADVNARLSSVNVNLAGCCNLKKTHHLIKYKK